MRPEVNWNQFEISLQCKISLQSTWQKWNFQPQWVFHVISKCPQWNKIVQNHLSCKLVRMCFAAIVQKATNSATSVLHWLNLHKLKYHLHMCNRVLLLFKKLPQWNLHINCHVNGTAFQSGLRFQTGQSSLRVSCKRALRKGVLKICSQFRGEHPCRSVVSIKLQSNFIEITLRHGRSPVNFLHIFKTSENLWKQDWKRKH